MVALLKGAVVWLCEVGSDAFLGRVEEKTGVTRTETLFNSD